MSWPQSLPLALLRTRTKSRTKKGSSSFEIVYRKPYIIQFGISTQTGSKILRDYIISLQKQLREVKKLVLELGPEVLMGLCTILNLVIMYTLDLFQIHF